MAMPVVSSEKSMTDGGTGSLDAFRYLTKSEMPPSYLYVTDRGATSPASTASSSSSTSGRRSSVSEVRGDRCRNATSWRGRARVSKEYSVVSKIELSAQNVVVLPVSDVSSPRSSG